MVWLLTSEIILDALKNEPTKFFLARPGSYTIGRKNCHIIINTDRSVSRLHADLEVGNALDCDTSSDSLQSLPLPIITLHDKSRLGTFVNKNSNSSAVFSLPDKKINLSSGDKITFGAIKCSLNLFFVPLVFLVPNSVEEKERQKIMDASKSIGAYVVDEWNKFCTHALISNDSNNNIIIFSDDGGGDDDVINTFTFTSIFKCIVEKKNILSSQWIIDFSNDLLTRHDSNLDFSLYKPTVNLKLQNDEIISIQISNQDNRKNLFQNFNFIFLPDEHFNEYLEQLIHLCGGHILNNFDKDLKMNDEKNYIVLIPNTKSFKWKDRNYDKAYEYVFENSVFVFSNDVLVSSLNGERKWKERTKSEFLSFLDEKNKMHIKNVKNNKYEKIGQSDKNITNRKNGKVKINEMNYEIEKSENKNGTGDDLKSEKIGSMEEAVDKEGEEMKNKIEGEVNRKKVMDKEDENEKKDANFDKDDNNDDDDFMNLFLSHSKKDKKKEKMEKEKKNFDFIYKDQLDNEDDNRNNDNNNCNHDGLNNENKNDYDCQNDMKLENKMSGVKNEMNEKEKGKGKKGKEARDAGMVNENNLKRKERFKLNDDNDDDDDMDGLFSDFFKERKENEVKNHGGHGYSNDDDDGNNNNNLIDDSNVLTVKMNENRLKKEKEKVSIDNKDRKYDDDYNISNNNRNSTFNKSKKKGKNMIKSSKNEREEKNKIGNNVKTEKESNGGNYNRDEEEHKDKKDNDNNNKYHNHNDSNDNNDNNDNDENENNYNDNKYNDNNDNDNDNDNNDNDNGNDNNDNDNDNDNIENENENNDNDDSLKSNSSVSDVIICQNLMKKDFKMPYNANESEGKKKSYSKQKESGVVNFKRFRKNHSKFESGNSFKCLILYDKKPYSESESSHSEFPSMKIERKRKMDEMRAEELFHSDTLKRKKNTDGRYHSNDVFYQKEIPNS